MGENAIKLNKNEKKFLKFVLDRGDITDSEICQRTGISKSTCARIRKKLEADLISEYIPIIELSKVGIDVFLVLTFQWIAFDNEKLTKTAFLDFEKDQNVIFIANGEGSISSTVMFIAFENLETCHVYLTRFREKYGKYAQNINTLILPSKKIIKNDFTGVIKKIIGGL